jgi:predicted DNA-binding ribbon-helix-helix protein
MKSLIVKRSVVLAGHKTSVSLEDAFWKSLKEIAIRKEMTLSDLLGAINAEHHHGNLSSAIRLFVLNFYREEAAARGRREVAQEMIRSSIAAKPQ